MIANCAHPVFPVPAEDVSGAGGAPGHSRRLLLHPPDGRVGKVVDPGPPGLLRGQPGVEEVPVRAGGTEPHQVVVVQPGGQLDRARGGGEVGGENLGGGEDEGIVETVESAARDPPPSVRESHSGRLDPACVDGAGARGGPSVGADVVPQALGVVCVDAAADGHGSADEGADAAAGVSRQVCRLAARSLGPTGLGSRKIKVRGTVELRYSVTGNVRLLEFFF